MIDKIYKAQVKHVEATIKVITDGDLERLLGRVMKWREKESNKHQEYVLLITDQYSNLVYGSRL